MLPHPDRAPGRAGRHDVEPPPRARPVDRFDQVVDDAFDRLRGNPAADRLFYAAHRAGRLRPDLAAPRPWTHGLRSDARHGHRAWSGSARLGVESVLVNGVIKSLFKRERPGRRRASGPTSCACRSPPASRAGHSSSAGGRRGAALRSGRPKAALYWGLAGLVATSRVYVRIHHASDVVGGVAVGPGDRHRRPRPRWQGASAPRSSAAGRARPAGGNDRAADRRFRRSDAHLVLGHLGLPLPLRPQRPRPRDRGAARRRRLGRARSSRSRSARSTSSEGEPDIWDRPSDDTGLLALQAGVVVRDDHPERFLDRAPRRCSRPATTTAPTSATARSSRDVLTGVGRRRRRRVRRRSTPASRSRRSARSTRPPSPTTTSGACPPSSPATRPRSSG